MGLDRCGCLGHRAFVGQLVWYCLPTCVSESRAETSNVDEVLKQGPIFVKQHAQRGQLELVGDSLPWHACLQSHSQRNQRKCERQVLCSMVLALQEHGEGYLFDSPHG